MKSATQTRRFRAGYGWLAVAIAAVIALGNSPAQAAQAATSSPGAWSFAAAPAEPADDATAQLDAQVEQAMQYMRTAPDESTYFDLAAAQADGADAAILDIGTKINQLASSQRGAGDDTMTTMLSLPLWGNWCGPGHGGGEAVDVLDSLCQTHDRCYESRGYFACSCDRAIVNDIRDNIALMTGGERVMAAAVSVYFTYCLCNPFS